MAEFVRIGRASDFEAGAGRVVEVRGRALAVFHADSGFHALDNACPHRGGPLGEGELSGGVVACPWHGHEFDVTTGRCTHADVAVRTYETRVRDGELEVAL